MIPRRPTAHNPKWRWHQWAFDTVIACTPQSGPGVTTCSYSFGTLRRRIKKGRASRQEDELGLDGFGFGIFQGRVSGTVVNDESLQTIEELNQYFVVVGYGYGNFGSSGPTLPQRFRFTSPFMRRSIIITAQSESQWARPEPYPRTLGPGESFEFITPEALDGGGYRWGIDFV